MPRPPFPSAASWSMPWAVVLCVLVSGLPAQVTRSDAVRDTGPDLVILGPVLTLDPARPRATGLVIDRGYIVQVTTEEMALSFSGPGTRILRVPPSGVAMPGVIDSHAHALGVGRARRELDLRHASSADDVARLVAAACQGLPPDAWVLGRGWNQELWDVKRFPDRSVLDAVTGGRPCALRRVDGHALWVNTRALDLAGITGDMNPPAGGEIVKDAGGHPTGVLVDNAMGIVGRVIPTETDPEEIRKDYLAAQEAALGLGITTLVDAGTSEASLLELNQLYAQGEMKLRMYAMLSVSDERSLAQVVARPPIRSLHGDRVAVRAIKLYADGALGSRGAWLLEPYTDRADHVGLAVLAPSFVERVARQALERGYQVCTHAIGDRGVRETLNAYERAFDAAEGHQVSDHRFRIEHAQITHPTDVPRFRSLRVFPSMQGCHCTSDGPWVEDRLGHQRARTEAYVWRSMLDAGCVIPNGTDAPVEDLSPWRNLFSTVTRFMELPGQRYEAFYPEQRMNRLEALLSLTHWGAHGIFAEERRGVLRPGYQADVIIINRDPMTCPVWHLGRIGVLTTIVDGEVVVEQ